MDDLREENQRLRAEIRHLRAELEEQWMANHDEHCTNVWNAAHLTETWPEPWRDGRFHLKCHWPRPYIMLNGSEIDDPENVGVPLS